MSTRTRRRPRTNRRTSPWRAVIAMSLVVAMMGFSSPAAEADGHEGPVVVASGLDQPRGLAFNGRGDLFVAEAGSGGDLEEIGVFGGALKCSGYSGAVTRVDKFGRQRRVAEGLASAAECDSGGSATGPAALVPRGRQSIYIQFGSTASFNPSTDLTVGSDQFGRLLRTRPNGTILNSVADVAGFEAAVDVDGEGFDSNPNDVAIYGRNFVVVDSGANSVHVVDRAGRAIRTVEVPQEPCPGGPGNCFGDVTLDSVPTGVVHGHGDIFFISTLSGVVADFSVNPPDIGFKPGNGGIFAFNARTGAIESVVDDLTTVVDVAYDRRSDVIYAAEFITGAVWAIDGATGERTRVDAPGDLVTPGGLAVDRDGNVYVSTFTAAPGMIGQVVRYDR